MRMKNVSTMRMLVSCLTELSRVFIRIFMLGTADKLLKGLKSLNVLIAETFLTFGMLDRRAVTTTRKSSQFHPSLR